MPAPEIESDVESYSEEEGCQETAIYSGVLNDTTSLPSDASPSSLDLHSDFTGSLAYQYNLGNHAFHRLEMLMKAATTKPPKNRTEATETPFTPHPPRPRTLQDPDE
ncbi:hypothetical protein N7481_013139 [Penicillium waksmanii]|uniref:uncharacterized protein n=1 Tax=Penicillium waksmanii TaxID=69791 RepID=UPI00254801DE|nr:uncharacterized protein N7481_013139 [Penicillium waksmanii]KAJ5966425.1 hypothetical protein N7481_013139 [Penicillium waksmanii]